jgi:hypothetical protein
MEPSSLSGTKIKSSKALQNVRYEIRGQLAMIENLGQAEPYCHQKGIFPAREAVVMQQQDRGDSENGFQPDLDHIAGLINSRTLDIVFDRIETCLAKYA